MCRGVGWILDLSGDQRPPISIEFLPCIDPECEAAGQSIEILSLGGATPVLPFDHVIPHPRTGRPMSLVGRPDSALTFPIPTDPGSATCET